jgi:aspartate/methionine/tyrosine aminotransferase
MPTNAPSGTGHKDQVTLAVNSKLLDVGTSIFSVIGDLAARHKAINLSQGAPNFPCSPVLLQFAFEAMRDGHNQYSAMEGLWELRSAIADKAAKLYGINIGSMTKSR